MPGPLMRGGQARGKARKALVLEILRANPAREWSAVDVHARVMRWGTLEQVKSTLRRLVADGEIIVVNAGKSTWVQSTYRAQSEPRREVG